MAGAWLPAKVTKVTERPATLPIFGSKVWIEVELWYRSESRETGIVLDAESPMLRGFPKVAPSAVDDDWRHYSIEVDISKFRERILRLADDRYGTAVRAMLAGQETHSGLIPQQITQLAGLCGEVAVCRAFYGKLMGKGKGGDVTLPDGSVWEVKTSVKKLPELTVNRKYKLELDTIFCRTYPREVGRVWIIGLIAPQTWAEHAQKQPSKDGKTWYWRLGWDRELFASPYEIQQDLARALGKEGHGVERFRELWE